MAERMQTSTSATETRSYPRPDFQRRDLRWSLLDGPWNFMRERLNSKEILEADSTSSIAQPPPSNEEDEGDLDLPSTSVKSRQILVPFVYQTPASNINDHTVCEHFNYHRQIHDIRTPHEKQLGNRLLLRFGAVDYEADVRINGDTIAKHQGGHTAFDVDITDKFATSDEADLQVRVRDSPHDLTQPRGKQYWKPQPESIFYTPSSGIWQSVWLEAVPRIYISESTHGTVLRSNDIENGVLHAEIHVRGREKQESLAVEIVASIGPTTVSQVRQPLPADKDSVLMDISMWLSKDQYESVPVSFPRSTVTSAWRSSDGKYLALWSPEHPLLYDISIKLIAPSSDIVDEVRTTTGMRSLSWNHPDNTFRLNGKPYFQALVLDQGYWPDTNITPPSQSALKHDIELAKAMGFNGCRKHQKVEDPAFLYWADRLGFLVWGEMANAYEFSSTYIDRFDMEWKGSIRRDINHPSIVTWTPINESWGYDNLKGSKWQRDHIRSLYYMTKALDPTRPVNDNCGWEHVCTDLTTFHEYADAPALRDICSTIDGILSDKGGRPLFVPPLSDDPGAQHTSTAPIICTEFGGVNIAAAEGEQAKEGDWGYTTASDPEDLLQRVEALVMAVVEGGLCCGFVYTQLTDIEQEVNGLYTFDRRPKLDIARVKGIIDRAKRRYFELLEVRTGYKDDETS